MDCWDWEFFETGVTSDHFVVADHGPLFGPVTGFTIARDENLNLILQTTSGSDSTTSLIDHPAGSVCVATAEVKLESRLGASARAIGVIPRSHTRTMATSGTTMVRTQISSIHSLQWERQDASAPCCIIEWVENLSSQFIWPHSDDTNETGEKRRTLRSPAGELVLSTPIESRSGNQSCVHLVIEGKIGGAHV